MNLLLLIVLALGCAKVVMTELSVNVINDHFNTQFLKVRLAKTPSQSVVVSSYSLLTPLAQLLFAAEGKTKEELVKLLSITTEDLLKVALPEAKQAIASASTSGITLSEANKIYIQEGFKLNKTFLDITKLYFDSEFEEVDFKSKLTVDKINSWVEEKTNHKIKDILKNPVPSLLMLINALYLKAKWTNVFAESSTELKTFHIKKSHSVSIPFMHQQNFFFYSESTEFNAKLITLLYGYGDASFLAVIPNEIEGLNNLMEKLNSTSLKSATDRLVSTNINLYLPKFKIETTTDLKETLGKLGLHSIFTSEADLANLIKNEPLYLTSGIQKTYIMVDEDGTEAAAINIASGTGSGMGTPPPPILLEVDRPFYFQVSFKGITLFSGVYIN